ncbi:MAG: tail fiber domain-containing protein, partial [Planctomycetota bacterium]
RNVNDNYGYLGGTDYAGYFYGDTKITQDLIVEGNVGIGTTSPITKLHVDGIVRANTSVEIGSVAEGSISLAGANLVVKSGANLQLRSQSANYDVTIYRGSTPWANFEGSVQGLGIGTTVPVNKLDVEGGVAIGATYSGTNTAPSNGLIARLEVNGQVKITGGSPGVGKVLTSDAAGLASWQTGAGGGDSDWTISGPDMYTGAGVTGNVGIGTISPSEKLDVNGNVNINSVYKIGGATILSNTGASNIFVGENAGASNTTGGGNTFSGYWAGYSNTTGYNNTFSGYMAGYWNTTGYFNTFSGYRAGSSNTTGSSNTFSGYRAGNWNTTGYNNTFSGSWAGFSNTTGYNNTFSGYEAGYSNTTGSLNTFSGFRAGYWNTTGYNNTFSGYDAGYSNTTGYNNTFSGYDAGYSNTTGVVNTFLGYQAGSSNTTGSWNTLLGVQAGSSNTTGYKNTFSGYRAGHLNTTGFRNTFLGYRAGASNSTGNDNVFLGYQAGSNETGSNKLYIDNSSTSTPLIYGSFSANRVGINRVATANTLEVGGNASKATSGSWLANSDVRIKTDIQTVTDALETLDKVRLVSFKYTDDYQVEHPSIDERRYLNVIAQEFAEVFPDYVKSSKEKLPNGDEILQVDAYPLTVYSAAAVQELHAIVKEKEAEIAVLKERMTAMEGLVARLARFQQGGAK